MINDIMSKYFAFDDYTRDIYTDITFNVYVT